MEVKELYFKEILPHLNSNNYGHDEKTVKYLKEFGKVQLQKSTEQTESPTESQEEFGRIEEVMGRIHDTNNDAYKIFNDPNDPLHISTKHYPRQPQNCSFDELHLFPIYEPEENENEPRRSDTGNIHVRDEIGSSIRNVHPTYSYLDHSKAPLNYIMNYPMFNFETGQVEAGKFYIRENNTTSKNTDLNFYMCDI